MPHWLAWVVAAGALSVVEIMTVTFILGPLAIAALAAAAAAAFGAGLAIQLLTFIIASLGTVFAVRPIARRHQRMPPKVRTGVAALAGERATVLEAIGPGSGRIKLAGEVWSARALQDGQEIPAGTQVTVVEIAGATAVVME